MRTWNKAIGTVILAAATLCFSRFLGLENVVLAGSLPPQSGTSVHALDDADPATALPTTIPTTLPVPALEAVAAPPSDITSPAANSSIPARMAAPSTRPATRPAQSQTQPSRPQARQSGSADQVSVKDIGTVEIHVNEANLVEVLRMLSMQSQRNIISSKDVRGTVTANLYDVTVKEALDAILHANGYDYREKGNFIYVYTGKEIADMEKAALVKKTEIFRLYYTPVINAANMIKPALSEQAQVSFTTPAQTGIDAAGKDSGGNSHATEDLLVVSDFPDHIEQVRAILKEVDRRPVQILVEATILQATLQENNDLGINFTALGGVDFNALSGVGTFASNGTGVGEALTGTIVNDPAAGSINKKGFGAVQAGGDGLKVGVVTNNVGAFITALEGVTDTVIVANPKVLVLNKQKGEVHVGSSLGYQTAVTTDTLTANNVQFLDVGTQLIFRPYVGDNGNIRMEVHPEDSSGTVAQGLPNKYTTQITTNVMVKDGHTIVIGGLFRESTNRTRNQVPGLGSLPGIGAAFRHQTDNTTREEVIILLTPHIIKDETSYSEDSERQFKEAERLRVGMRRGLMPWGRDRMAESSYEKAVAEMNKANPDRKKAIWHLNCATDLNPMFSEAIDLRSKLTGREVTSVDNSSIRDFVRREILSDKMLGLSLPSDPPTVVPPLSMLPGAGFSPAGARDAQLHGPATRPAVVRAAPRVTPATRPVSVEASAATTGPATRPSLAQDKVRTLPQGDITAQTSD